VNRLLCLITRLKGLRVPFIPSRSTITLRDASSRKICDCSCGGHVSFSRCPARVETGSHAPKHVNVHTLSCRVLQLLDRNQYLILICTCTECSHSRTNEMITVRDVSVGHLAMALPPLPRNHPPCPLCFLPSWWWEGKTSVARAKNSSAVPAVSTATLLPRFASLNLSPPSVNLSPPPNQTQRSSLQTRVAASGEH